MNTFEVVMGDWSGDGHNITETAIIKTNLDHKQIVEAMTRAQKELDIKPGRGHAHKQGSERLHLCEDYEDNTISFELAKKLKETIGFEVESDTDDEDEEIYLYSDAFLDLWIKVLEYGARLNGLEPIVEHASKDYQSLLIGGYGLFSM